MEFQTIDLGTANKVALQGRLDASGVAQIEIRFIASIVPAGKHAIIDLSGVDFLSSLGIRLLIMTARSLRSKKAQLVVFGARPLVKESLESVAIGNLVPIAADESGAMSLLES
jgi:anti-anti-sigma factor